MSTLFVYYNDVLLGYLQKDMTFQYDAEYLALDTALPLSFSLPLRSEPFAQAIAEPFFEGLLPEGNARSLIAKAHKVSSKNTFALLQELGRDCAGALVVSPSPMEKQERSQEYDYKTEDEAYTILSSLPQRPLFYGEDDFCVSGAGAQDKLIACIFDDKLALPLHGTPSTHIIKPEIHGLPQSCYNELFCMRLAKSVGFAVPNTFLFTAKEMVCYVVERYDRKKNGLWCRRHQEDFCQALGVPSDKKYQSDGGPSLKDCFTLLNDIGVTASDKMTFLNMVIFNYIIGNNDAHAKNFSIMYNGKKPSLAPCYDIMSTVVYDPHYPKSKMAMKIASQNYFSININREKFAMLSEITGFRKDFILKCVDTMCDKIQNKAQNLAQELNADPRTASNVYDDILAIISKHSAKLQKTPC